jgi:hypothetical protein
MLLAHETSLDAALAILRTGRFIAGPILGDAGLNCVPYTPGKTSLPIEKGERSGVTLLFEWSGSPPHVSGGYVRLPNNLYADAGRFFVPVRTNQHLTLVDLLIHDQDQLKASAIAAAAEYSRLPSWLSRVFNPSSDALAIHCENLLREIREMLDPPPAITIVFPENCIYRRFVDQQRDDPQFKAQP